MSSIPPPGALTTLNPDEPDVDYFEADRLPRVARRAAAIDEAAAAFGELCLDAEEVWDASALPDAEKDAAANVAIELVKIESLSDFFRE